MSLSYLHLSGRQTKREGTTKRQFVVFSPLRLARPVFVFYLLFLCFICLSLSDGAAKSRKRHKTTQVDFGVFFAFSPFLTKI